MAVRPQGSSRFPGFGVMPGALLFPSPHDPLPGYAELLCRSNFSFLGAASHPEELIARARTLMRRKRYMDALRQRLEALKVGHALERGIGIRFKDRVRTDVEEYCISEGWIRVQAGKTMDRKGQPLTLKLNGPVEAWFEDLGDEPPVAKKD